MRNVVAISLDAYTLYEDLDTLNFPDQPRSPYVMVKFDKFRPFFDDVVCARATSMKAPFSAQKPSSVEEGIPLPITNVKFTHHTFSDPTSRYWFRLEGGDGPGVRQLDHLRVRVTGQYGEPTGVRRVVLFLNVCTNEEEFPNKDYESLLRSGVATENPGKWLNARGQEVIGSIRGAPYGF